MAKVALPLHYPDQKPGNFILTESIHIIEVDTVVVPRFSNSNSNSKPKPKSNVPQHSSITNITNITNIPPQISTIALSGRSHRLSLPNNNNNNTHHNHNHLKRPLNLTPSNGYTLTTIHQHYTPPSTPLESLFMEATSCRSSQPGVETIVSVWNYTKGIKHPNGLFPPFQLGVSGDEGVLSIYRSYKAEDLNFYPSYNCSTPGGGGDIKEKLGIRGRNRGNAVWWSDIMYEVWRKYSASSSSSTSTTTTTASRSYLGRRENATAKLRFIAIPEVNNEEVKIIAHYAFEKRGLDKDVDMLVVDRDDRSEGSEGWTLFDAFLGTASVKAINRMAVDHANELGYIIPSRVYVKYSGFEYPSLGEVLLPNLLVEMRRVKGCGGDV